MQAPKTIHTAYVSLFICAIVASYPSKTYGLSLREKMPGEGYLRFQKQTNGEERTGWTDIRHPAFFDGIGGPDVDKKDVTGFGYDRSDFQINVRNVYVKDLKGISAEPGILRDYDFANQIYAQLGISVLNAGNVSGSYDAQSGVEFPISTDPPSSTEIDMVLGAYRADPVTINNYYIRNFIDYKPTTPPTGTFGFTRPPLEINKKPGILVVDPAFGSRPDTFAHELGHFLLNEYNFITGNHSPSDTDLMADGSYRMVPLELPKAVGREDKRDNDAPGTAGQKVGDVVVGGYIGGKDLFESLVDKGNPSNPTTRQIHGIFDLRHPKGCKPDDTMPEDCKTYIQKNDNSDTFGDIADFDWVEDNLYLQDVGSLPNSDNNPADNHNGKDELIWEIGELSQPDHARLGHMNPTDPLELGQFNGESFKIVDIISQISRYADMDIESEDPNKPPRWSPRGSALDYDIWFSADGKTSWQKGELVKVFDDGWTDKSQADDFVARWSTTIPSKFIKIAAKQSLYNDGNTQIDAIIASNDANAYCPPAKINDKLFQFYYSPYGNFQCTFDQLGNNYLLDVTFQPTVNESLGSISYSLMITDPAWSFESLAFSSGGPTILKEIWYNYPGSDNPSSWSTPNQQLLSTSTLPDLFSPGLKEIWVRDTYYNITPGTPFYSRSAYSQVPGPLPVLGAGAAFRMSRKLRNRIKMTSIIEQLA